MQRLSYFYTRSSILQVRRRTLCYLALLLILLHSLGCTLANSGSSGDSECEDCLTVSQLAEEYEANSLRARQEYVGKRRDFAGEVESVERDRSVPPKPLIRLKSGGDDLVVRFDWGDDYSWVTDLNKGHQIMVNCVITSLGPNPFQGNKVTPSLDQCTRVRESTRPVSQDSDRGDPFPTITPQR